MPLHALPTNQFARQNFFNISSELELSKVILNQKNVDICFVKILLSTFFLLFRNTKRNVITYEYY